MKAACLAALIIALLPAPSFLVGREPSLPFVFGPRLLSAAPQSADSPGATIRIGVAKPGGYTVVTLSLESYVARVLTGEALPDSPPAALEALAVAVRTYTLANRGRHGADGFDLCNETHCQVMRTANTATEQAAAATAGLALLYRGAPASIYYSASCGGRTEIPSEVWPGMDDPPYLPSQKDDGCGGAPAWTTELADRDLLRALNAAGYRGRRLRDLKILSRNASGRVARLRLVGLEPDVISGPDLRAAVGRTLGWQHIRSTAFVLKREPNGYHMSGHGSGHGVGMCVIGATRLAGSGETPFEILHRYYPGLAIAAPRGTETAVDAVPSRPVRAPVASPAVTARTTSRTAGSSAVLIALPRNDERERPFLSDLSLRARTELARLLGVEAPGVTMRFHGSAESFERATAQPWFTAGAVVRGEIHLLPPAVLRSRGMLEPVIRRELARVMIDPELPARPLWVREGAAVYFSESGARSRSRRESPPAMQLSRSCPEDAQLISPVSPGALTAAYDRAEACFARQLAQGRGWRDVR